MKQRAFQAIDFRFSPLIFERCAGISELFFLNNKGVLYTDSSDMCSIWAYSFFFLAHSPTVSIIGPPVMKMDPSLVKGFKVKCEAVGDPLPTINWLVDEHPLTDSYNEFTVQDHIDDLTTTSEVFVPSR